LNIKVKKPSQRWAFLFLTAGCAKLSQRTTISAPAAHRNKTGRCASTASAKDLVASLLMSSMPRLTLYRA
jgi:hypothetical protein